MLKKLTTFSGLAVFLLFVGSGITPAQAHHCKGSHDVPGCVPGGGGGGAGGDESGKHTPIKARILLPEVSLEQDNDDKDYVHNEGGVKAQVGGETQPNRPGVRIELRGSGKNPRTVRVNAACSNPDVDPGPGATVIGNCTLLPDNVFGVQRAELTLGTRPYEVNCPDPDPATGECLDVFTMGAGPVQMSFRVGFFEQIVLEIASDIGGSSSPNPGRCLSLLSAADRAAFLNAFCNDRRKCNVTVTASDDDMDGRNDFWTIVADKDTALICDLLNTNNAMIGVADVSFTMEAEEK